MSFIKTTVRRLTLGLVDLRSSMEKHKDLMDARNKRIDKRIAQRPANYKTRILTTQPQTQNFNSLAVKGMKTGDHDRVMDSQLRGEMAGQRNKGNVPFTFGPAPGKRSN